MFQKFHRIFNQYKALYMSPHQYSGREILKQLGIQAGSPVIVFIERKALIKRENSYYLERALHEGLARVAGELRAIIVDGGVASGVLGSLNTALRERHHPGLYIGVAPIALTNLPNQPSNGHLTALGDAHTHFVLVEGDHWGDEIPVMYNLIGALSENTPYLRISIKNENTIGNGEKSFEDDENADKIKHGVDQPDKISLQLLYPGVIENPGSEKMMREETFLLSEIGLEVEKLASRIRYYLKAYSTV